MLKLKVEYYLRPIIVSVDADRPNQTAAIAAEGIAPEGFLNWLSERRGAFGHSIEDATTPIDLHYAIATSGFPFEVLEGEKLVEKYDPDIPEGAMT